jgi:hypothetical protein
LGPTDNRHNPQAHTVIKQEKGEFIPAVAVKQENEASSAIRPRPSKRQKTKVTIEILDDDEEENAIVLD